MTNFRTRPQSHYNYWFLLGNPETADKDDLLLFHSGDNAKFYDRQERRPIQELASAHSFTTQTVPRENLTARDPKSVLYRMYHHLANSIVFT